MEKIYHTNINWKIAEVAILISEGADFKVRRIIRNKEHYIIKKINNSYCACVCQTIEHQTTWDKKLIELQGGIDESSVVGAIKEMEVKPSNT